jgi:hypothetical protein
MTTCKRHREIDVEGSVTDRYSGLPIPNAKVALTSYIKKADKFDSEDRSYETSTYSDGSYIFHNAYFSRPEFSGAISVLSDKNYIGDPGEGIDIKDAKLIGHTKLRRNLTAICLSKLNVTVNISPTYSWSFLDFYLKFNGPSLVGNFDNFVGLNSYPVLPDVLIGYSNGKNIIKSELKNLQGNIIKTQFDTIVSNGCGSSNNYTININ